MYRILVVDDEPDLVELLSFNLRIAGYQVISAGDGPTAIALARQELPDLILLDLLLPELDGISVCEILRRSPDTATIPIIMLTAWNSDLSRIVGMAMGANAYLTKPFKMRAILGSVRFLLAATTRKSGAQRAHVSSDPPSL